ncbi:MAG: glycosyltransferase [Acidimicrobiia bacterium]|nr:glycosyltransferase [Acidimicrobiia bacterium]MDH4362556.1 glycosyltransferase [Acidimicrobiia bacterium]
MSTALTPLWVSEIELADSPPRIVADRPLAGGGDGGCYQRARILIRLQGEPLGVMSVALTRGEAPVEAVVAEACEQFAPAIERRLGTDWRRKISGSLPLLSPELAAVVDDPDLPGVTVVVGTRNRPEHALNCVARVLKQTYPGPVEVIVVDNGASSDATGTAIATEFGDDQRVRYIHETRPGLSRARNIGLAAASHPITAFLSDDIVVDSLWLAAVVRAFRRAPDVRCVVGYCPPMYLDTEAQLVFEKAMAWGWRNGFEARLVGPHLAGDRLYPYRTGIGVGANMSFDTAWFRSSGGFDETLGPGTIARGGEDLDAPIRVLLDGGQCVYEPAAIGWHADRYDDRGFGTHMYTYGVGLTAFLASHLADRRTRWQVIRRAPFGARHLLTPDALPDSIARLDDVPMRFRYAAANMAGRFAGPILWVRSRRALRGRQGAGSG